MSARTDPNVPTMGTLNFSEFARLLDYLDPTVPIMLHGAPGIGKSAVIMAHPKLHPAVQIGLATRQPEDITGCPMPDKERRVTDFFPPADFHPYAVTAENPDPVGCLFFDEYDKGDDSKQTCAMRIFSERRIEGIRLGKNVRIIVAANRAQDNAGSYHDMPRVMRNRLTHFEIAPDFEYWKKHYAEEHGTIHPLVVEFLERNPNFFMQYDPTGSDWGFPTPRSWEKASHILDAAERGMGEHLARTALIGTVGNGATIALDEFRKYMTEIPPINEIAEGKAGFPPLDRPDHWVALVARCVATAEMGLRKTNQDFKGLQDVAKVLTKMEEPDFKMLLASHLNRRKLTRKLWTNREIVGDKVSAQVGSLLHKLREHDGSI